MKQLKTKALKRKIKEAIKKALLNKTVAMEQVEFSRTIPTQIEHLPKILIYFTTETIERHDEAPKTYMRRLSVKIECIVAGDTDDHLDEEIEEMGAAVEEAMEFDETLGKLVHESELKQSEYETTSEGQSPMGVLSLTYELLYQTQPIPGQVLRDFVGYSTDWKVGHHAESSDEVIDAEDEQDFALR